MYFDIWNNIDCNPSKKDVLMNTSKKGIMVLLAMVLIYCNGCRKSEVESSEAEKTAKEGIKVCTMCGQIKGSELCCKPNQAKCPKCGLAKGSPGCCKIPKL